MHQVGNEGHGTRAASSPYSTVPHEPFQQGQLLLRLLRQQPSYRLLDAAVGSVKLDHQAPLGIRL